MRRLLLTSRLEGGGSDAFNKITMLSISHTADGQAGEVIEAQASVGSLSPVVGGVGSQA